MTTTANDPPAGDPPAGAAAGDTGERLTRVEAAVGRIETALARIIPASHADAQQRVETRLDRPASIEEQVQAELAKARQEQEAQAAADAEKAEREDIKAKVATLTEKPPEPPVRRATRLLGWGP